MLGRGRSFRTTKFGPLVQQGRKSLTLYALSALAREHRIGLQKTASQTTIKIDGEAITRLSDIARITPLQILTPMSHEILERGPEYRRRFMEWGVFHVEHAYFGIYKQFAKALKQRNMVLKTDPGTVSVWNPILGKLGEELNILREQYFTVLENAFAEELRMLDIQSQVNLSWRKGWDQDRCLEQDLEQKQQSDIKLGYTHIGPHRADFRVSFDRRSAFTSISRGQQKMIISALHLAQASITKQKTGNMPIILFDDLVAELDNDNRGKLLGRLRQIECQAFVTATDEFPLPDHTDAGVIRVEQGDIARTA